MSRSFIKSFHRSGKKKANKSPNTSINNNTITEDDLMNQTICCTTVQSPPSKFYRTNSNPFPVTIKSESPIRDTRKKSEDSRQQKSFGEKILRLVRPSPKKKELPSNDDGLKTNEVPNVSLKHINVPFISNDKTTQVYEKSINKYGDVVEYALPYNEREKNEFLSPANESGCFIRFDDVIDENVLNDSKWNTQLEDIITPPNIKITDLDESVDGSRLLEHSGEGIIGENEVLAELDLLEQWSQNISESSVLPVKPPLNKNVHIIKCQSEEIQQTASVLRSNIGFPLHFSSGTFRKTPVTLRKCYSLDFAFIGLIDEAILRDYEILGKMKHSNIILLVAASFPQQAINHMTLLLEATDYTLNYFLHQMNITLSLNESISVVQQIAGAALYLQESGYIHSNISSHNILVRKDPWCVKLSSFELTTEVDYADTRAEIFENYREKLSSSSSSLVSDCVDMPKYTTAKGTTIPLKERYQQMSRLVPVLKCTHNTPHEYLYMQRKYLMYNSNYRQHLSPHNFQAPELITTKLQFVFPTKKADVYSLCLLLWELLNKCVPFVVYSKSDMETLIETKKLNFPFFERERCESFMDIFQHGLAVNPEDRSIDVQQLMTMLEDVKFRVRYYVEPQNKREKRQLSEDYKAVENDHERNIEDVFQYEYTLTSDAAECTIDNSILSPNSVDFNRSLNERGLTSSREKQRKISPRKPVQRNFCRQLFQDATEATSGSGEVHSSFDLLNELNENAVDNEIQHENTLDETEVSLKNLAEKREPAFRENVLVGEPKDERTNPKVLDSGVGKHNFSKSKSRDNLIDGSCLPSRRKFFHSNVNTSLNSSTNDDYLLPPIARKNKILRNAWLSNNDVCSSNNAIDKTLDIKNRSIPLDERNNRNISIRIVCNKVTPKKNHGGNNTSVISRMKLSDSDINDDDFNFMIPRRQSVRDKIKKFEKDLEKPSS